MDILQNPEDLQDSCRVWRRGGRTTALVPTMGYFHEGHLSLMRWARENADRVVVSLFVNPTQFGPGEDLDAYPRDFARDRKLAEETGVDALFCPPPAAMYQADHATWVEAPSLAEHLCGKDRPVHFRGVATVLTKLFFLALPDLAVFGEKDWQQLTIIRRLARDLNTPTRVVGLPTVREADGLAMSSRNVNLSPEERAQAPHIRKGLELARSQADEGVADTADILAHCREYYAAHMPLGREDYVQVVHADTIRPVDTVGPRTLIAAAFRFSRARLIDNLLVRP